MPLGTPLKPSRYMFAFHEPILLSTIDEDDADDCAAAYRKIRREIETGISDLVMRAGEQKSDIELGLQGAARLFASQVLGNVDGMVP